MESIRKKEEMSLAEARRVAATKMQAAHRGKTARMTIKEQHTAAVKLQAASRGRASRRANFNLAEAQHLVHKAHATRAEPVATKKLSIQQLGLKSGLPKNPVPSLRFMTFNSWWTEMGTKRYMELCFDLETELFQVILDKQVQVLDCKLSNNADYESLYQVIDKDTKVMSMHLHEKLSGNQHAESLRRPHLQCWDLHVGCRVNVLGRPTTLMQCNLVTGQWLEYHADRLGRIKHALEESLRKYETVPMAAAFTSQKARTGSGSRVKGSTDLRTLMNQIEALAMQLETYRPNIARSLLSLASVAGG